jgi:hypothetical protein
MEEKEITSEQALNTIYGAIGQLPLKREDHELLVKCCEVLAKVVKESLDTSDKPSDNGKVIKKAKELANV